MDEEHDPNIRVFVVWEPVLLTDFGAPSTATLRRASDPRVSQYWDKGRLVSRTLGERDRASVVWDYVAVYRLGALWEKAPPEPLYSHGPVVGSVAGTKDAVRQALASTGAELSRLAASVSGRIQVCVGDYAGWRPAPLYAAGSAGFIDIKLDKQTLWVYK